MNSQIETLAKLAATSLLGRFAEMEWRDEYPYLEVIEMEREILNAAEQLEISERLKELPA
jgi:hypothetical protein